MIWNNWQLLVSFFSTNKYFLSCFIIYFFEQTTFTEIRPIQSSSCLDKYWRRRANISFLIVSGTRAKQTILEEDISYRRIDRLPRPFGVISCTSSSTVIFSKPFCLTISIRKKSNRSNRIHRSWDNTFTISFHLISPSIFHQTLS